MKQTFVKLASCMMIAAGITSSAMAQDVPATRLLTDDFDYATGNLYSQKTEWAAGDWMRYGSHTNSPVQVIEGSLTYSGYQEASLGNSVKVGKTTSSGEDVMVLFSEPVGSGSVFVGFLLKPLEIDNYCVQYFLSLFSQTKAGMGNMKSGSETGRLFAKGNGDGTFKLGIHRAGSASNCVTAETNLELNQTYFVVMEYRIVDDVTNDIMNLWVNPTKDVNGLNPDATYNATSGPDINLTYGGVAGLELRQQGSSNYPENALQIDALRVATSWAGLFDQPATGEATISLSPAAYTDLDAVMAGSTSELQTLVTASGLTDDITVTCSEGITCNVQTISKDASALTEGYLVKFNVCPNPTTTGPWSGSVTFSSPGAADVVLPVSFTQVVVPTTVPQAFQINTLYETDGAWTNTYRYTGKAVVTAIEQVDYYYLIYAQDMTGAFCINTGFGEMAQDAIALGDEISDFLFYISDDDAVGLQLVVMPTDMETGAVTFNKTATGKTKTPVEISLSDYVPADNQYKLVKLTGVSFAETGNFTAKSYPVTDGNGKTATVRPFAGTDLIGTEIPASANVVGISKSKSATVVWPRFAADIEAAAPEVTITPSQLFDFATAAAPINSDTQIMKYTVNAKNITAAAPVTITGINSAMYSVSPAEIPAGTGVYELIVTYRPTAIGTHKGAIGFNFDDTSSALNATYTFPTCKAYDPQNPPTLTLDPSEVTLTANEGESSTATVTLSVANACDYINVQRGSTANLGITINSSLFVPSVATNTITVTFRPVSAENVQETFTFSTLMGTPVTLTVNGNVTGTAPDEEKEGDEFILDTSNPLSVYYEDFETVEHNQPLSIEGWTNVAMVGTRAWWGYVNDEFSAAKVTAYDSKVAPGNGTECQMLLVSPALDFENAPYKVLKFDVMGKGLYEGMQELLEICLIEMVDGEPVISPMDGFNIPVTADYNNTWVNYDNIDMSVIPDIQTPFFIGFRMTGTRGSDNAAQYFIDNFTWGSAPTGIDSVNGADNNGLYTVYNLQGFLILDKADAEALRSLPAGIYIVNGKKCIIK